MISNDVANIKQTIETLVAEFKDTQKEYSDVGASDFEVYNTFNYHLDLVSRKFGYPFEYPSYTTTKDFWQLYEYEEDTEEGSRKNFRAKQCGNKLMKIFRDLYELKFRLLKALNNISI